MSACLLVFILLNHPEFSCCFHAFFRFLYLLICLSANKELIWILTNEQLKQTRKYRAMFAEHNNNACDERDTNYKCKIINLPCCLQSECYFSYYITYILFRSTTFHQVKVSKIRQGWPIRPDLMQSDIYYLLHNNLAICERN